MLIRTMAVAALAIIGAARVVPAVAADLDSGYRGETPYDDPRYSDIYRHPAPPPPRYAAPYYQERYVPPPPPPPYGTPIPRYQSDRRHGPDCLPQHVIRDELARRGWHDFHDPHVAGNVAHVRARRPSGRLFDLTVDRCTGEVLQFEPIDRRSAEAPDWRYRGERYGRY